MTAALIYAADLAAGRIVARRRGRKVRTLTAWGRAVTELLSLVDQTRNGRDPRQGPQPQRTAKACAPQRQPMKS